MQSLILNGIECTDEMQRKWYAFRNDEFFFLVLPEPIFCASRFQCIQTTMPLVNVCACAPTWKLTIILTSCSLAPRAHYIFATLHIHTNSFGIQHSCIYKSNGIKRKKKVSPCTMKAIVPEHKDMIGVVGRLRTKHDWN